MRRRSNFSKGKSKKKREGPYNLPNEEDIASLAKSLETHMGRLNEDGTVKKEMTQSQKMSLIRGAIREKWMYAPNKLAYLDMNTVPDYDPSTRRRFKVQCESCKEWFTKSNVCVDHVVGEHSLKSLEDFDIFIKSILYVGFDGLQILCHDCHDIKTAMERYNLSDEEVIVFKKVTAWEKQHPKANQQKKFLIENGGFKVKEVSNADLRREAALKYFKNK